MQKITFHSIQYQNHIINNLWKLTTFYSFDLRYDVFLDYSILVVAYFCRKFVRLSLKFPNDIPSRHKISFFRLLIFFIFARVFHFKTRTRNSHFLIVWHIACKLQNIILVCVPRVNLKSGISFLLARFIFIYASILYLYCDLYTFLNSIWKWLIASFF